MQAHCMQNNSRLPKQTTGQNQAKLLLMFICISKMSHEINKQKNQALKTQSVGISHANWSIKTSSEETQVAKELVLEILNC